MFRQAPPPLTSNAALFLDFDGTLVEMAPTPSQVEVSDTLPSLLSRVATMLNGALAIVTGRPIRAIDEYLADVVTVAGLHGAEMRDSRGRVTRIQGDDSAIRAARVLLNDFKQQYPEVLLEDKELSLALHFRNAPDLREKCQAMIDLCVANANGRLERLNGACVTEIKPKNVSKAHAIEAFMKSPPFHGRYPIFAGDDITDDAGFAYVAAHNGLGIIIGNRVSPTATRYLPSVSALHLWLHAFVTG